MNTYNIAIIEDDQQIRNALSEHFSHSTQINCAIAVDTTEKFLKFQRDFMDIRLILLDVMLYQKSSIPQIPALRQQLPEAEIVMFTVMDDPDTIFQALRNGAHGYLLKDLDLKSLEEKIVFCLEEQGALLSPAVAKRMIEYFNPPKLAASNKEMGTLTEKELVVVRMLQEGHTYETIARQMCVSVDGVRYHVKNVYRKLQVHSKGELIRRFKLF